MSMEDSSPPGTLTNSYNKYIKILIDTNIIIHLFAELSIRPVYKIRSLIINKLYNMRNVRFVLYREVQEHEIINAARSLIINQEITRREKREVILRIIEELGEFVEKCIRVGKCIEPTVSDYQVLTKSTEFRRIIMHRSECDNYRKRLKTMANDLQLISVTVLAGLDGLLTADNNMFNIYKDCICKIALHGSGPTLWLVTPGPEESKAYSAFINRCCSGPMIADLLSGSNIIVIMH